MENKGPFYAQIDAWLTGQLPPDEQQAMQKAIGEDPALAREIEIRRLEFDVSEALIADNIRQQLQRLRTVPATPENPTGAKNRMRFLLLALILLVAAVGIYRWNTPALPPTPAPAPAKPGPATTPAPPSAPVPQANNTPENPDQTPPEAGERKTSYLALATALYQNPDFESLRGTAPDAADPLETALSAWQKQDYAAVITLLQTVAATDPKYWRAMTLVAHAQFKLNRFGPAARTFAAIADGKIQPWAEDADGYVLLAMLAGGQSGTAAFRSRLNKVLVDTGHPWFEQAKTIQSRLARAPIE